VLKLARVALWLVVILLLLSPGLWLAWKHQERLEALFFPPESRSFEEEFVPEVDASKVTALGRVEPAEGITRVAGPSRFAVVVSELLVDKGQLVQQGQLVALLDSADVERAEVARLEAELEQAKLDVQRSRALVLDEVVSQATLDRDEATRRVLAAQLKGAQAELERSHVRSPINGRVFEVHARSGEKVGPDGIVELADTAEMIVTAEVYEDDVAAVRVGQRAVVRSPAFPAGKLGGTVRRVGLKVSRKDVLSSDPVADVDSRVVEVEIALDEPEVVAALTHLRVEVAITTGS